ncbi:MAG: hypothetical protein H8E12_19700 [Rhodobacteraceae bacterium]|nr:hypothetical protein [Paracoccaceae bacterium]
MNILNNNTFRIITACILGVIGTLVIQEVTSETELLTDVAVTAVTAGTADTVDIVNVVNGANNEGTSNNNNTTENSSAELDTVTAPNATTVEQSVNNK